jgi:hypothetical protein
MSKQTDLTNPPFDEIQAVVEYLIDSGELSDYCSNPSRNHIFYHVHQILHWMAQSPETPKKVQRWVDEINAAIAAEAA